MQKSDCDGSAGEEKERKPEMEVMDCIKDDLRENMV